MRPQLSLAEKFWPKVAICEHGFPCANCCWPWLACLHGQGGYGNMRATPERPGNESAHVVAWFLTHGTWPEPGIFVCHSCDTPPCCNPAHLFLGTHTDNMQDSIRKGRNGMKTKPECAREGQRRWNAAHPTRPQITGDRNGMRLHPELVKRGDHHPNSKLTEAQVEECCALYATGQWTFQQLGERYGVTGQAMGYRIRHSNTPQST
jgi:hypothetical protein